ncbi:MAG: arginine repressor [Acidimicrobiia bacterium]|nr:arginine repressor [Acidimicrobiia bacterium]
MNTASRRRLVRRLLADHAVSSQGDLVALLRDQSHDVTQATVSRDLHALGAVKSREGGRLRYVLPEEPLPSGEAFESLARALSEFAESIAVSHNLIVVRTSPGAAHVVAAAVDAAPLEGVLGSIAGDDTLMVIADEKSGGRTLARRLEQIGAG